VRILVFDTSAHSLPWPLFLEELGDLVRESPSRYAYTFVDEAQFLRPRSLTTRLVTRVLDWTTMNIADGRRRALAYRAATRVLHYRRHPVSYRDLNRELLEQACSFTPDMVLIVMGFHIDPGTLAAIKEETKAVLVNYATDDPFNGRVGTPQLMKSIPLYDLYLCTKRAIMDDVARAGCRDVRYLRFGFKPRVHFCEIPQTADELKRFAADIAFVGEGDADRLPYFLTLAKELPDVNLALYGGLWNRHPATRRYFRGNVRGRDFRMALGGAKIAVNLIRRENRDDHVMRTFEGPACGAFMLNERTDEHLKLFEEGSEAAYFGSAEELVDKARYYLAHDNERERIRAAGYARVMASGHAYKNRLIDILNAALPN
jgi:hypothetical protein